MMNNDGMTQLEVTRLIQDEMIKYNEKLRSLGCGSEVGSMAMKSHIQYHGDKLDSDIINLKNFREKQMQANEENTKKFTAIVTQFHDIIENFTKILKGQIDLEKKLIDEGKDREKGDRWNDAKIWGVAILFVGLAIGSIWMVNKSVSQVNKVDVDNQANTETYLAILVQQLDGGKRSIADIVNEHKKAKEELIK
jgi:hypothetical protein